MTDEQGPVAVMRETARSGFLAIVNGHGEWRWFVAVGIASLLLGVLGFLHLALATMVAVAYLGAVMLLAGMIQISHAVSLRRKGWSLAWFASGILYAATAIVILFYPLLAAALLTILLSVYLAASGIVRCAIGIAGRHYHGHGWLLLSGVTSIVAALLIGAGWPVSAVWMPGLVLCADLIVQGAVLAAFGLYLKRSRPA